MYKVLIVDDDTISRVAIAGMIQWSALGLEIAGSVSNGKQALDFIGKNNIDVLITDIKMPIMDGTDLISKVREKSESILIIALSSYNDFDVVRKVFKNNIEDYIMKSELSGDYLTKVMESIQRKLKAQKNKNLFKHEDTLEYYLQDTKQGFAANLTDFYCIAVQICDYELILDRFEHLKGRIILQVKEVIAQIPKISTKCYITEHSKSTLIVCCEAQEEKTEQIVKLCEQIYEVIKNYMNIEVRIALSDKMHGNSEISKAIEDALLRISMHYVFGTERLFLTDNYAGINVRNIVANKSTYADVLESFKMHNSEQLFESEAELFNDKDFENVEKIKNKCLELIYFEAQMLEEVGDSIFNVWGRRLNFNEKLMKFDKSSSIIMWAANFNRVVMEYLQKKYDNDSSNKQIEPVKHYIEDNYACSTLSLAEVASISGLNEKYFSSKFKKETGVTFVEYVTNVRIEAAKKLLKNTNMKIVEISDAVGYNNSEHFVRVFKKKVGLSPREYAQSARQGTNS